MPVELELSSTAHPVPGGVAFDRIAAGYDEMFTYSAIGRAQRRLVDRALQRGFARGSRILELNCGTGEDALRLAARGIEVLACDASPAMIDVCRQKLSATGGNFPIAFFVRANEGFDDLAEFGPFDGALSNFGGLNCTADVSATGRQLASLIRPGGTVFLCVMGRVCAWEIVSNLLAGRCRKAFRRLRRLGSTATIGGLTIRVHYPSVRRVARAFAPWFRLGDCRGVGVFVPPSGLEPLFRDRPRMLRFFEWLDRHLGAWPLVHGFADHILIRFEREAQ